MNNTQHAAILAAYINALPLAHIEAIQQTQRAAWEQGLNGNRSTQGETQRDCREAIANAVAAMNEHDLAAIAATLKNIPY